MRINHLTRAAVAAAALALTLGACSDKEDAALPDVNVSQTTDAAGQSGAKSVVGLLTSVEQDKLQLKLGDGSPKTIYIRPEDAASAGLGHLASHAGLTDIGFEVEYETVGGKDYFIRARETAPPQPS